MSNTNEQLVSRFFEWSDPHAQTLVYEMPQNWWSRPYEYEWARQFCQPDHTVLDAACGVCHPFKFYMVDVCKEVHACDLETRILSPAAILADIAKEIGLQAACTFPRRHLEGVQFRQASITSLPYPDGMFDTIFCVSVLEHLNQPDQKEALAEFKRALKPDGLIVLTVDFPTVDLQFINQTVRELGLEFAGPVHFEKPTDAVWSTIWGLLYCFRFVLRKLP